VYDHPFLWGSKRIGPDLSRSGVSVENGGKIYKGASWHYVHLIDPESISPGSVMPPYDWLAEDDLNTSMLKKKIAAHRTLGTPYPKGYENEQAQKDLEKQALRIANEIRAGAGGPDALPGLEKKEIVALIAYLHKLGSDIHPKETAQK
jgi:cytochrome c oxidase cbb3-type subunit I/II